MKKTGFYAITAAAVLSAAGAAPLSSQAAQDPYLAAPGRVAAVFSVPAPAVGTLPGLSGLDPVSPYVRKSRPYPRHRNGRILL